METKPASRWKRIWAYLIDWLFMYLLFLPLFLFIFFGSNNFKYLLSAERLVWFLFLLVYLIITLLYFLLKDSLFNGRSLGKCLLKIKVLDLSGKPCNKGKSIIRNLMRIIPIVNLIDLLFFFFAKDGRRLGDRAASTKVVLDNNPEDYKINKRGSWMFLSILIILVIVLPLTLNIYSNTYKAKHFIYNLTIILSDGGFIPKEDVLIINERIALAGYYADINITPFNGRESIVILTDERFYNNKKFITDLISRGIFNARIGNITVFSGGKEDISDVCRYDASCSRIEACYQLQEGGEYCIFSFVIYLSEAAAQKHADVTSKLGINMTEYGRYLDKKLDLYLDNNLVNSLLISENLKGQVITQLQVQGSGSGKTRDEAINDARENMHKLQTILITGGLSKDYQLVN